MGYRPSPKHRIERIDNNGDYKKSNCTWATNKEQSNNRRSNKFYEYNGRRLTMSQWCDAIGMPVSTFKNRLYSGLDIETILTKPIEKHVRK